MGDAMRVDDDGLRAHAEVCDTVAADLSTPAPTTDGHATQATTVAVARGHALIDTFTARLSTRATSTGQKLRVADDVYRTTDSVSARNLAAVSTPVEA